MSTHSYPMARAEVSDVPLAGRAAILTYGVTESSK